MITRTSTQEFTAVAQRGLLSNRRFRTFWIGDAVSLFGDQFYSIALPWLVLQLTGNPAMMGLVLAVEGVPRAAFMLIGGALTDRFSPRNVMLVSNLARMVLVALLALLTVTGMVELWMVMVLALLTGLGDSVFYAGQSAIVPGLVDNEDLQGANAVTQGTGQLTMFVAPALAGMLIAVFGQTVIAETGETAVDMTGIAAALGLDALTFLASAVTLWLLPGRAASAESEQESVLQAIRTGLVFVWSDVRLRGFFILISLFNLLISGPLTIGVPVLADQRLPEGAAAFGIVLSAFGGGMLLGTVAAALLPAPPARIMGLVLGAVWGVMGIGLALFGWLQVTALVALVAVFVGMSNGYVTILFITWLQKRTPSHLLGRTMSLLMFASMGLTPISHALTGVLIDGNVTLVFTGAGVIGTLAVWAAMFNPRLRSLAD